MARGARRWCWRHVRADERKAGGGVIERSAIPSGSGVAIRAVADGECGAGSRVHRIVGLLPGGEMATGVAAIRRRNLESVVAANVAGLACDAKVFVGEREAGGAVIEFSVRPFRDGMARSALRGGGRETGSNVIGNISSDCGGAGE